MRSKSKKILFLLKKRHYYGYTNKVNYGLLTSCELIKTALEKEGIECVIRQTIDDNTIDKEIFEVKPTHVFLEAIWTNFPKVRELVSLPRYSHIKFFVRVHSKVEFLSNEGCAFSWLLEYNKIAKDYKNFKVAFNNSETVDDFQNALGVKSVYAPNIYLFKKTKNKPNYSNYLKIGSFSALRIQKNIMNQAVAALQFAREGGYTIEFHVKNSLNHEKQGENILKNLKAIFRDTKHKLVVSEWTSHVDFLKLVRSMDLMMNVSASESFCVAAADGVSQNIPVIGSPEIKFLDNWYQVDPNDINSIAKKLDFAHNASFLGVHRLNEWKLNRHNDAAIKEWIELLK